MNPNGRDEWTPLAARVAAVEAAIAALARRWEQELVPRLVAMEEELAGQREALTTLAEGLGATRSGDRQGGR